VRGYDTMQGHSPRSDDPWGLEAERRDEQARRSVDGARSAERRSRRWVIRHSAPIALGAAVLVLAGPVTAAASSSRPAALPRGVPSVQINAGEKGSLYSSFQALGASSGGVIVSQQSRLGNGLLYGASDHVVPAGKKTLVAFSPPGTANQLPSVAGPIASVEYVAHSADSIYYRDIATSATGSVALPSGSTWFGSTPTGWLLSSGTTLSAYDIATKKTTTLKTFSSAISAVLAGPDGAVVQTTAAEIQYVTYSPIKVTTLVANTDGNDYFCPSATTNAAGCLMYDSAKGIYQIVRLPLPSGTAVTGSLPTGLYSYPAVTPKATAWLNCGTGTTCTLEREAAKGGTPVAITLPRVTGGDYGGLVASGDNFIYGRLENSSAAGGLFALADTSTEPSQIVSAPTSPLAAADVSLNSSSVAWADNSKTGIGIYTRPITVTAKGVTLGTSALLAQSGFVSTDSSSFGLSLSNASSEIAYSTYLKQPAADPMGLALDDKGKITQISSAAGYYSYSEAYSPTAGPQVGIAGSYVLLQTPTGSFSLYDVSTAHSCALPSTNVAYALGNGASGAEMIYVAKDGGVYEAAPGCSPTSPRQIAPPLKASGATVDLVSGLGIAGNYVAWSYGWYSDTTSGLVASWINLTGGGVKNIANPSSVVALVLSTTDIGVTTYSAAGTALYGVSLPSGAETLLATDSYDLSVGNGVAAWIGQHSSSPFAGKI
jgi:hypothetical protein